MMIAKKQKLFLSAVMLAAVMSASATTPAKADDDHRGVGHGHERAEEVRREHEWREHEAEAHRWHKKFVAVYPPQVPTVVYTPPPVVYTPPPPPEGINLIIPLNFR